MQDISIEDQVHKVIEVLKWVGLDPSEDQDLISSISLMKFARHPFYPEVARNTVLDYLRTLPGFDEMANCEQQPMSVMEAHSEFREVAKRLLDSENRPPILRM